MTTIISFKLNILLILIFLFSSFCLFVYLFILFILDSLPFLQLVISFLRNTVSSLSPKSSKVTSLLLQSSSYPTVLVLRSKPQSTPLLLHPPPSFYSKTYVSTLRRLVFELSKEQMVRLKRFVPHLLRKSSFVKHYLD